MMFAPYRRSLALCVLLAANLLLKSPILAQGVATIVQTVKPADPGLTWQPPAAISFGTPVSSTQLDATAATAGTFTYTPVAGTILPPGPNTLSVSFKPDNPNFLAGTLTVSFNVLPSAVPGFSFVLTPASMAQGPFVLQSGKTAPIHFTVAQLLNFDQMITFSCSDPLNATQCAFAPAASPLLPQPFDVSLVVQLLAGSDRKAAARISQEGGGASPSEHSPRGASLLTSGLLAAALFGSGLRRRRFVRPPCCIWISMLSIPVAGLLMGCGGGRITGRSLELQIIATSPYESHSVQITVVTDQIGGEPIGLPPLY